MASNSTTATAPSRWLSILHGEIMRGGQGRMRKTRSAGSGSTVRRSRSLRLLQSLRKLRPSRILPTPSASSGTRHRRCLFFVHPLKTTSPAAGFRCLNSRFQPTHKQYCQYFVTESCLQLKIKKLHAQPVVAPTFVPKKKSDKAADKAPEPAKASTSRIMLHLAAD